MSKWEEYYLKTKELPPSPLLVKALALATQRGHAIDIGGGALKDARYLLDQGFHVTVIDKGDALHEMAAALHSDRLQAVGTSFEDYAFPEVTFTLASAMFSLPFTSPEAFTRVFTAIKGSLVPGGIFCGQFFGVHDAWSANPRMTFHTKEQVEELLADLDVIELREREYDGKLASGEPKHWHVFSVIARQR